jgi:hypothetical protein
MTTAWTLPSQIEQYAETDAESVDISWDHIDNIKSLDNRSAQSTGNLIHTARSPKLDIKNKTYFIRATGFNFQNLPDTVSGIEVRLNARRYGRATDDTIELCLDGLPLGENQATRDILPQKIYGSETSIWNAESISISDVQNNTFGVVIRFRAHPDWPHKDPVLIDSVEIRIH